MPINVTKTRYLNTLPSVNLKHGTELNIKIIWQVIHKCRQQWNEMNVTILKRKINIFRFCSEELRVTRVEMKLHSLTVYLLLSFINDNNDAIQSITIVLTITQQLLEMFEYPKRCAALLKYVIVTTNLRWQGLQIS